jgi:hypothetical protein
MTYKVEVMAGSYGVWISLDEWVANGPTFETEEAAEAHGRYLMSHRSGVRVKACRIVNVRKREWRIVHMVEEERTTAEPAGEAVKIHPSITEDRIMAAVDDHLLGNSNTGFCIKCGADHMECKPNAEKYHCEVCKTCNVYGAEQLMIMTIG